MELTQPVEVCYHYGGEGAKGAISRQLESRKPLEYSQIAEILTLGIKNRLLAVKINDREININHTHVYYRLRPIVTSHRYTEDNVSYWGISGPSSDLSAITPDLLQRAILFDLEHPEIPAKQKQNVLLILQDSGNPTTREETRKLLAYLKDELRRIRNIHKEHPKGLATADAWLRVFPEDDDLPEIDDETAVKINAKFTPSAIGLESKEKRPSEQASAESLPTDLSLSLDKEHIPNLKQEDIEHAAAPYVLGRLLVTVERQQAAPNLSLITPEIISSVNRRFPGLLTSEGQFDEKVFKEIVENINTHLRGGSIVEEARVPLEQIQPYDVTPEARQRLQEAVRVMNAELSQLRNTEISRTQAEKIQHDAGFRSQLAMSDAQWGKISEILSLNTRFRCVTENGRVLSPRESFSALLRDWGNMIPDEQQELMTLWAEIYLNDDGQLSNTTSPFAMLTNHEFRYGIIPPSHRADVSFKQATYADLAELLLSYTEMPPSHPYDFAQKIHSQEMTPNDMLHILDSFSQRLSPNETDRLSRRRKKIFSEYATSMKLFSDVYRGSISTSSNDDHLSVLKEAGKVMISRHQQDWQRVKQFLHAMRVLEDLPHVELRQVPYVNTDTKDQAVQLTIRNIRPSPLGELTLAGKRAETDPVSATVKLSDQRHLTIVGENGSGKTTLSQLISLAPMLPMLCYNNSPEGKRMISDGGIYLTNSRNLLADIPVFVGNLAAVTGAAGRLNSTFQSQSAMLELALSLNGCSMEELIGTTPEATAYLGALLMLSYDANNHKGVRNHISQMSVEEARICMTILGKEEFLRRFGAICVTTNKKTQLPDVYLTAAGGIGLAAAFGCHPEMVTRAQNIAEGYGIPRLPAELHVVAQKYTELVQPAVEFVVPDDLATLGYGSVAEERLDDTDSSAISTMTVGLFSEGLAGRKLPGDETQARIQRMIEKSMAKRMYRWMTDPDKIPQKLQRFALTDYLMEGRESSFLAAAETLDQSILMLQILKGDTFTTTDVLRSRAKLQASQNTAAQLASEKFPFSSSSRLISVTPKLIDTFNRVAGESATNHVASVSDLWRRDMTEILSAEILSSANLLAGITSQEMQAEQAYLERGAGERVEVAPQQLVDADHPAIRSLFEDLHDRERNQLEKFFQQIWQNYSGQTGQPPTLTEALAAFLKTDSFDNPSQYPPALKYYLYTLSEKATTYNLERLMGKSFTQPGALYYQLFTDFSMRSEAARIKIRDSLLHESQIPLSDIHGEETALFASRLWCLLATRLPENKRFEFLSRTLEPNKLSDAFQASLIPYLGILLSRVIGKKFDEGFDATVAVSEAIAARAQHENDYNQPLFVQKRQLRDALTKAAREKSFEGMSKAYQEAKELLSQQHIFINIVLKNDVETLLDLAGSADLSKLFRRVGSVLRIVNTGNMSIRDLATRINNRPAREHILQTATERFTARVLQQALLSHYQLMDADKYHTEEELLDGLIIAAKAYLGRKLNNYSRGQINDTIQFNGGISLLTLARLGNAVAEKENRPTMLWSERLAKARKQWVPTKGNFSPGINILVGPHGTAWKTTTAMTVEQNLIERECVGRAPGEFKAPEYAATIVMPYRGTGVSISAFSSFLKDLRRALIAADKTDKKVLVVIDEAAAGTNWKDASSLVKALFEFIGTRKDKVDMIAIAQLAEAVDKAKSNPEINAHLFQVGGDGQVRDVPSFVNPNPAATLTRARVPSSFVKAFELLHQDIPPNVVFS